jgi:hypothetical protein
VSDWQKSPRSIRGQLAAHRNEHDAAQHDADASVTCRCTRPMLDGSHCVKCGRLTPQALKRKRRIQAPRV